MKRVIWCVVWLCASTAVASQDSIGPNGINSEGLLGLDGLPLTGKNVRVGEVDVLRPADPDIDTTPALRNTKVDSAIVLFRHPDNTNFNATPNATAEIIDPTVPANQRDHPTLVAGVIISTDNVDHDGVGPLDAPLGVARQAQLYAVGGSLTIAGNPYGQAAWSTQKLIETAPGITAINHSYGIGYSPAFAFADGNSDLSQYLDWSASRYDVLHVVAGNENGPSGIPTPIPTDQFNGITVASSTKMGGKYVRVSSFNTYTDDFVGDRTSIHLIAPGEAVSLASVNNGSPSPPPNGTSFAAPHVTGTVALLQQFGQQKIDAKAKGWETFARAHEIMKAVLINSADKIADNTSYTHPNIALPVPQDGFLGMEKTVVMQNGTSTWFDSPAWNKDPITGGLQPLDIQMGAGALNAKRALKQYSAGDFNPGFVPTIGWSFTQSPPLPGDKNTYTFNRPLKKGSFVSITLAFDRQAVFANDADGDGVYDYGDTFVKSSDLGAPGRDQLGNLDLYLRDSMGNIIAESITTQDTIDHIFWQIPDDGKYEFRVQRENNNAADSAYAVAWWALGGGPVFTTLGDFNFDEVVDNGDISSMLQALTDVGGFQGQWGLENSDLLALADLNHDGQFTNADIQPELDLVASLAGSGALSSVPEPSTWLLLAFGLPIFKLARRR
jgi:hypothetical protein